MNDNGLDLIIYLALTLGASVLGLMKSSKEKKAKRTQPKIDQPEDEPTIILQQPEDIFQSVWHSEELSEKMEKERQKGIANFGKSDEERYAMLEKIRQKSRQKVRMKQLVVLPEEDTPVEQQNEINDNHFEMDIRKAVIANEILNRKY